MSKITFRNKKEKIIIVNRLSYPETVNERVYNAIAGGMFERLIPVSIHQKRKETRIECVVQGLIPLSKYFSGVVTKKMFLDFVYEIILLIKDCEKNMVNANNLDLQSDKIFVDSQTKSIKCIFWPIVNNQRENPPHLFLKQLPYDINFNTNEDNEYLRMYKSFFSGNNPFSINSFEKMISQLLGKKNMGRQSELSEALFGTLGNDERSKKNGTNLNKNVNIEYDPFSNSFGNNNENEMNMKNIKGRNYVFCSFCGMKNHLEDNFCKQCGAKLKKMDCAKQNITEMAATVDSGTVVLGDDSGGTTVLGYEDLEVSVNPVLIRVKTGESYPINTLNYRIGSEKSSCELFIGDNIYISKKHAVIITRNDRYYIKDQNSKNKTYVDGRVIPVEKEIEIFLGTQIRLANEDFIFNIEL